MNICIASDKRLAAETGITIRSKRFQRRMLKKFVRRLLTLTPYRIVRHAENRFQGIDHCLRHLGKLGYAPRRILDGGAYDGTFALACHAIFPAARIDMIEPQFATRPTLEALARAKGFAFHPQALTQQRGTMRFYCNEIPDDGAHVERASDPPGTTVDVEGVALDDLFGASLDSADRALLKLDLQGWELVALKGGPVTLARVEVLLIEVSIFKQHYEPSIPELVAFLDRAGFELYDVGSLSGRTRDDRLRQGDLVFVRRGSALLADSGWE